MLLCEEYLKRHAIAVPMMQHVRGLGSVFFKEQDVWCVKQFEWQPPDTHPGSYNVTTSRSVHNGLERGRYFEKIAEEQIQWDEYEHYLLDWISVPRCIPSLDKAITIAQWEILLRCCDNSLIRHVNYEKLFLSIDFDLPMETRYQYIQQCVDYFAHNHREIHRLWAGDLQFYREHYASWLAEMAQHD